MRKLFLFLPLLTALPLCASDNPWEVGAFVGRQSYSSTTVSGTVSGIPGSIGTSPSSKTIAALRVGYDVLNVAAGSLQVSAGFQPSSSTDPKGTVTLNGYGSLNIPGSYKAQQVALGAMFNFNTPVALGAGLDARIEKLTGTLTNPINGTTASESVTMVRPWLRLNGGYVFPGFAVKPFVKVEVAAPLVTHKLNNQDTLETKDLIAASAPKVQVGLYLGVRF